MALFNITELEGISEVIGSYFRGRQQQDRSFTYRRFADELGGLTPQALSMIVAGKRLPSPETWERIMAMIGLSPVEMTYGRLLLAAEKPTSPANRLQIKRLMHVVKLQMSPAIIPLEDIEPIAHWHHLSILEMLELQDFRGDPAWIAERLGARITAEAAAEALALLCRRGMIELAEDGRWRRTAMIFRTQDNDVSQGAQRYHQEMLEQAKAAIAEQDVSRRMFTGVSLAVDQACVPQAQEAINEFLTKMIALTHQTSGNQIYHLGIQFFALTNTVDEPTPVRHRRSGRRRKAEDGVSS